MAMVYDLPQVSPTAAPMNAATAPQVENYAPKQGMQMAGAVSEMAKAATVIQDNINEAATKEADNKLSEAIRGALYDPDNGYLSRIGKNAIDARTGTIKAIQDSVANIPEGLTNDAQKAMFKRVATARMQQAMQQIDAHAMQQTKVYSMGQSEARIKGLSQDAIAAHSVGDTKQYNDRKQAMLIEADSYAGMAGSSPEQKKQYRLAATSSMSTNIIEGLINNGKAKDAQQYYKDNKGDINPDLYDNLDKKVGDAVAYVDGKAKGAGIFTKYAPKTVNDSIKSAEAKMLAEVEKSNGTEHEKEYARRTIKDMTSQYAMAKTGAAEDVSDEVHGFMNGNGATYSGTINLINQRNSAGKIDNSSADSLRAAARAHFKVDEAEADAKAQRRYEEMARGLDYLQRVMQGLEGNPTQQDVLRKKGAEFGPSTPMVAKGVDVIRNNLANPKLTESAFNKKLSQMGEKVLGFNPDSKEPEIKRRKFGMFLDTIDAMAKEGSKGPAHTQPSLESAILGTVKKYQIEEPMTVMGVKIPFTGKEVRAYDVNKLSDKEKRDFVIKRIREAGRVPTPKAIADALNKLNSKSDRGIYNNRYSNNSEGDE